MHLKIIRRCRYMDNTATEQDLKQYGTKKVSIYSLTPFLSASTFLFYLRHKRQNTLETN